MTIETGITNEYLLAEIADAIQSIGFYSEEIANPLAIRGHEFASRRLTEQAARLECALAVLNNRPARKPANDLLCEFQDNFCVDFSKANN